MRVAQHEFVALNQTKQIFRVSEDHRLVRVNDAALLPQEKRLQSLTKIEYFRNPFTAIVAASNNTIKAQWKIHPNAFYPLSPLDYAEAVSVFHQGETPLPLQVFGSLSDRCNFNCEICFTKKKRTETMPKDIPGKAYLKTLEFLKTPGRPLTQTISGGGEASLHPDFIKILNFAGEHDISTFLTTNGSRTDQPFLESIARNASIATFSIQGISEDAYSTIMHPPSRVSLKSLLKNIETISNLRTQLKRTREMLIGVSSIIHPANTGFYTQIVRTLIDLGVDYIHFNPILPSLKHYGIHFKEEESMQTQEEMESLMETFKGTNTLIRISKIISLETGSFFFDPHVRKNPEVCLVALLQPSILPIIGEPNRAKVTSCHFRSYSRYDQNYCYSQELGPRTFESIWSHENLSRVQKQTKECDKCSVERQLMALDWMLYVKKNIPEVDFYLLFPVEQSQDNVMDFGQTLDTSYLETP